MIPKLAPICRNVPDNATLKTAMPHRPYQVSVDKLDDVEPVISDRDLFSVSATNVFESVDREQLRKKQASEFGKYIQHIQDEQASLPDKETTTTTSYYSLQDGSLFKSRICLVTSGREAHSKIS